jgi:hypothetical protein
MNADEGKAGRGPHRPARAGLLAAALAGATLLAAGCGGGSGQPGTSSGPGPFSVQKMDSFAACMRGHGMLNFYFSARNNTPSPSSNQFVLSFGGFQVVGVNPQTAQFQSAMKACRHILGIHPPSQAVQHKQFEQALKQAACMRSHGYPDWPDPSEGPNGQGIMIPGPPSDVDPNSPQVQKAAKACGVGLS